MNCEICGSPNIFLRSTDNEIRASVDLFQCRKCGFSFLSAPNGEHGEEDKYWDDKKQEKIYSDRRIEANFRRDFSKKLAMIGARTEKGRLLDVGCGTGQFLQMAKADGWDVFGLDISAQASRIAREKYGLTVFVARPEEFATRGMMFDCITMWDVIEHFKRPLDALKSVREKLADGGLLAIRTPNEDALIRRLVRALSFFEFKSFLKYVYYTPHYFYFNRRNLTAILQKSGFKIEKVRLENTDFDFARSKIDAHYRTKEKALVKILLPLAYFFSNLLGMQNKLVVFARKG